MKTHTFYIVNAIFYYFILFYFILFYFILFYFILFYFILFYFILFYLPRHDDGRLGWYSRTPLIRPPSESHLCGRIRVMVAREGFVYEQKPLSVTRNVVV